MKPVSAATNSLSSPRRRPGPPASRSRPATLQGGAPRYPLERLLVRAAERGVALGDAEITVGNLLFHQPGRHLDCGAVVELLRCGGVDAAPAAVSRALATLARHGLVQEIEVEPGRYFYDIDLRPHVHVYDPVRGTLEDATTGVVVRSGAPGSPAGVATTY